MKDRRQTLNIFYVFSYMLRETFLFLQPVWVFLTCSRFFTSSKLLSQVRNGFLQKNAEIQIDNWFYLHNWIKHIANL